MLQIDIKDQPEAVRHHQVLIEPHMVNLGFQVINLHLDMEETIAFAADLPALLNDDQAVPVDAYISEYGAGATVEACVVVHDCQGAVLIETVFHAGLVRTRSVAFQQVAATRFAFHIGQRFDPHCLVPEQLAGRQQKDR